MGFRVHRTLDNGEVFFFYWGLGLFCALGARLLLGEATKERATVAIVLLLWNVLEEAIEIRALLIRTFVILMG